MTAAFPVTLAPASHEAMRAIMRSFDDDARPFTAHRGELSLAPASEASRRPRSAAARRTRRRRD